MKNIQKQLSSIFTIHFFILLSSFFIHNSINAQSYGTSIGVRVGDGLGATLQQQVAVNSTVEAILVGADKDLTLHVLYEHHKSLLTRGLNFYLGAGLYKSWLFDDDNLIEQPSDPYGISPIMGLELTIARKLNLSADIKPNIRIGGTGGKSFEWHTGVSVRYVIAGRYFKGDGLKFWKKWKKKK